MKKLLLGEIIEDMFLQNKTKLTDAYWKREDLTATTLLKRKKGEENDRK